MSILSPERQAEVAGIRAKVLSGTATIDDMRRAVIVLREGRMAAQAASAARGGGRSKAPVDVDKLFDELGPKQ